MKTNTISIQRGTYGEITTADVVKAGREILAVAIAKNLLEAEYFTRFSAKNAEALNYDVYDVDGATWLIQQRFATISKYGTSVIKNYFLLRRKGRGIVVETVEQGKKATANRAAKAARKLGDAIRVLRGELKLPGAKVETAICYKAVGVVDGQYRSIYENSVCYEIGKTLVEKAQDGHGGGYYVYPTEAQARNADVPWTSDNLDAPRVVLECQCSGRSVSYGNGKIAYTRIKPIRVCED